MIRFRLLFSVLAFVILGYVAFWYWAAAEAEAALKRFARERANVGERVDFDAIRRTGFPYRVELHLENLRIDSLTPFPWSAHAAELIVQTQTWSPRHVILKAPSGEMRFSTAGSRPAGPFPVRFERLSASAILDAGGLAELTVSPERITWMSGDETLFEGGPLVLAVLLTEEETLSGEDPTSLLEPRLARLGLRAESLELHGGVMARLGPEVARLIGDISVRGQSWPRFTRASLADWRDRGGTLEIDRLEGDWSGLSIAADGSLTLDSALRPLGAVSADVGDIAVFIDRLAASGSLTREQADAAKRFFAMMQAAGAAKEPIRLPLGFQDGMMSLGPVPIWPLEPLL